MLLPTYDIFDEARYFVPGETQSVFTLDGMPIALTICEDGRNDKQFGKRRSTGAIQCRRPAKRCATHSRTAHWRHWASGTVRGRIVLWHGQSW